MSFIYAEKNPNSEADDAKQTVKIYSDTKTTLTGAVLANWNQREREAIRIYGFLKSVIIGPTCCISFAGNNTIYAQKHLKWIFEKRIVSDDEMVEEAMRLHKNANKDDIEFIICSSNSGQPVITCIKNGVVERDVSSAWIGSPYAFQKLQELRLQDQQLSSYTSIDLFSRAIEECGDDSVGGFVIESLYNGKEFVYPYRLESSVSKPQIVRPGESICLFDIAENGGYTAQFRESRQDVIIDFVQIDVSVIYTAKYRYKDDIEDEFKKHLMLPFEFCTSTGRWK